MVSALLSRIVILVFGTLYPAYASYKAVRTKNVKEYVKWMMYWIVFALFTTVETFSDVLLSWVPFYYELKMLFVLWMLTPYTRGSNFLYRKVVHPQLVKREKDIDDMIAQASKQGYATLLTLGTKGLNYATNVIARTALRGHGHIVDHLRRSYSTSDISMSEDGSGLAIQRREQYEEEEGSEDELDNRLREDNEEIARRAQPARIKKSHTNPGLSSVKEEEEEEVVTSEEVIYIPAQSKKKYTTKEPASLGSLSSSASSRSRQNRQPSWTRRGSLPGTSSASLQTVVANWRVRSQTSSLVSRPPDRPRPSAGAALSASQSWHHGVRSRSSFLNTSSSSSWKS